MKKPRSDATLKTLSPDRQKQVITWLNTGSQAHALKQIKQHFGLCTSPSALTRFYAWWHAANPLCQLNRLLRQYLDQ